MALLLHRQSPGRERHGKRKSSVIFLERTREGHRESELLQKQHWGNFWERGWSACGLFRGRRYHLELNTVVLLCAGDGAGSHCQPLLLHVRVHGHLQPAAEANPEWDRALPRLLPLLRVQVHRCQRGMLFCIVRLFLGFSLLYFQVRRCQRGVLPCVFSQAVSGFFIAVLSSTSLSERCVTLRVQSGCFWVFHCCTFKYVAVREVCYPACSVRLFLGFSLLYFQVRRCQRGVLPCVFSQAVSGFFIAVLSSTSLSERCVTLRVQSGCFWVFHCCTFKYVAVREVCYPACSVRLFLGFSLLYFQVRRCQRDVLPCVFSQAVSGFFIAVLSSTSLSERCVTLRVQSGCFWVFHCCTFKYVAVREVCYPACSVRLFLGFSLLCFQARCCQRDVLLYIVIYTVYVFKYNTVREVCYSALVVRLFAGFFIVMLSRTLLSERCVALHC